MTPSIRVSVVVPVYNREKYLRQCVDSIVAQTLREIEIILVDDGSTDGSPAICDDYAAKDSRVKVIHKKNAGMGAAYNSGMAEAKGEYIGFVETDDWIEPEMYKELYEKAIAQNSEVVKSFWTSVIGKKKTPVYQYKNYKQHFNKRLENVMETIPALAYERPSVWSGIYRRNFLETHQIKYPETPGASMQDLDFFWLVYTQTTACTIVPKAYYNCQRDTPDSSGHQGFKTVEYLAKAFHRTISVLLSRNIKQNYIEMLVKRAFLVEKAMDETTCTGIYKIKHARLISKLMRPYIPHLRFTNFSEEEKKEYLYWIRHPYFYAFKNITYRSVSTPTTSQKIFMGLKLTERKTTTEFDKRKVLYIPIRKKVYDHQGAKIYYLGLPLIRIKNKQNNVSKYFMGIRYRSKYRTVKQDERGINYETVEKLCLRATLYALDIRELHKKTFSKFREIYTGRDVVVVGCGPSLNYYRQVKGAIHIGVNRAFLANNVTLDYLFMQDWFNISTIIADACEYRKNECIKFFGLFPHTDKARQIPDCWAKRANALRYYENETVVPLEEQIYYGIESFPLAHFWASGFQALHFAFHTNPKRIFLCGFDCNFRGYFNHQQQKLGADQHLVTPQENSEHLTVLLDGYRKFKKFQKVYYPQTELISVNPVGLKGLYRDVYTEEYIKEHPEIKNYTLLKDYVAKS